MIEIKPMNNTDKYNNSCRCPSCDKQLSTKDILEVSVNNNTPYISVKCECGKLFEVHIYLEAFMVCA
jgi:hypothetical protein